MPKVVALLLLVVVVDDIMVGMNGPLSFSRMLGEGELSCGGIGFADLLSSQVGAVVVVVVVRNPSLGPRNSVQGIDVVGEGGAGAFEFPNIPFHEPNHPDRGIPHRESLMSAGQRPSHQPHPMPFRFQ